MEFLMTYGWAILVVLAAIGALAYFGVLSPDRFLPDKCTANPPFACTQYKVTPTLVNISVQNSAGVSVSVINVNLSCDGGANAVVNATATTGTLLNGNSGTWGWTADAIDTEAGCGGAWSAGDRFRATYDILYQREGETVTHLGSGSLQVRAEAS